MNFKPIESLKLAGYSVFKFVSLTKENLLFTVASGPLHSETLIQLNLCESEYKVSLIFYFIF